MKRFLSLLLSLFMVLSLCPIQVEPLFASTETLIINDFDIGSGTNQMTFYGSWGTSKNYPNLFYNGDEHWANIKESNWDDTYVEIRFFGTAISVYGKQEGVGGIQSVYIDDELVGYADAYGKKETQQVKLFDSSDYGVLENDFHVLRYQPSKTKNEAASGYNMQVDYAEVTYDTTGVVKAASFEQEAYELKLGHALNVVPTLYPSEADATITYSSDDESIAQVDQNGNLKPKAIGTTQINAYIKELDQTLTYTLNVIENVREIKVDDSVTEGPYYFTYSKGWASDSVDSYGEDVAEHWSDKSKFGDEYPSFTFTFTGKQVKLYGHKCPSGPIATVYIDDVEVGSIDYYASSRKNNSLLFDSGEISEGPHVIKVQITADKNEAASASHESAINYAMVYINEAYFAVTGITLNKASISLEPGLEAKVSYTTQPSFAENVPDVIYSSEDESIATVTQDGTITALQAGTTNIVATLDGTELSDSVKVVVRATKEEFSAQVSDNNTHRYQESYLDYLAQMYDSGTLGDRSWSGAGWKNDHLTSRIDLFTRTKGYDDVRIEVSDFVSDTSTLSAEHIDASYLLAPLDSKNNRHTMDIISGKTVMDLAPKTLTGIWVDIYLPKDATPGVYHGTIQLKDSQEEVLASFDYTVEVLDILLPDELSTHLELWMYPYSSNRYYSKQTATEYFNTTVGYGKSDTRPLYYVHLDPQYEAGLRSQLELYAKAGGDAITVTVVEDAWSTQTPDVYPSMVKWKKNSDGTWSFDYTDLDYWVNLNLEYGIDSQIKSFSLSPWGGRITYYDEANDEVICESVKTGGARWEELYTIFLTDYMKHMEEKGWFDITYLSMDELSLSQVQPVINLVHSIQNEDGESFKISLAANSYEAEAAFDDLDDISLASSLLSRDDVIAHRNEVGLHTTFYTCGGGYGAMANPPGHSAFAVYTAYKHDVKGYLRWALDSFNAEPYETGANQLFVDGDLYLIYPDARDSDEMQAKSSPRFEKFIEGMREVEKLKYLETEHAWLSDEIQQLQDNIAKSYSASFMQEIKADITALSKKAIKGEPIVGIHFDENEIELYADDQQSLTYTTYPLDLIETSNHQQIWLSDDENITFIGGWSPDPTGAWTSAKLDQLTSKGYEFDFNGNYFNIVGKSEPYLCQLDVYVDDVYLDTIDPYSTTVTIGKTIYASPLLEDGPHHVKVIGNGKTSTGTTGNQYYHLYSIETGSRNDVTWSSDSDIVSIDENGTITALKAGVANVKVSFMNYEDTISVKVKEKRITLDKDTYYLAVNGQQNVTLTSDPINLLSTPNNVVTYLYNDSRLTFNGGWGSDYTGKWINITTPEAAQNTSFSFAFTGNQFKIIGNKESVSGACDVYLNGEYYDTYDPYMSSRLEQETLYLSEKLPYGEYQVEVRGNGETSGTRYNMHIYAIEIMEYENVVWSVADTNVASIENQVLTALASGETILHVGSSAYQTKANVIVYDKTALEVELSKGAMEDEYTVESWNAYVEAYDNAQMVYAEKEITQAEIDTATQALQAAFNALEKLPQQIENVVATATNYKTIQLTWDAYKDATSYIVERFTNEGEWMEVATTTEPTYTHVGVKTGKAYTYRVKADNSEYSETVSATAMLEGEVVLTLTNNGETKIDLTWTSVEGATRYIIYRKANDGEWKKVLTLGKDATTYTSKDMLEGTYAYQVKAARYDSVDRVMTEGSNEVVGIIGKVNPTLTITEENGTSVTLAWDKVPGMKYYEVYRAKDGGAYRQVKRTTNTSVTSTSLKAGSTYTYKVRAFNLVNDTKVYTDFSNEVTYSVQ